MSNSYVTAMAMVLLLTSISSVAGLTCYFCYDDGTGPGSCKNSTTVEKVCEPEYKACYQDTYLEDSDHYKKGEVHYRYCTNETKEGCTNVVQSSIKVEKCVCKADMCNDGTQSGQQSSAGTGSTGQGSPSGSGSKDQESSPETTTGKDGHKPSANSTGSGSNPAGTGGTGEASGHHHHPLLLIAASVLTAVLISLH